MTAQSPSFAPRSSTAASVAFWSRSSSTTVSTFGVVDRLDLGRELEVRVVAELHLGPHLDRRLEPERLALDGLDDLHVRVRQRHDVLLDDRLAIRVLHEVLDGLVEDGARPEDALEDRPRAPCPGGIRRPGSGATGGRRRP